MADYIGTNGFTYNIPRYVDPSSGPTSFKNFADSMPSFGVEVAAVSGTVTMSERHRGRILRWAQGGEYVVNDTLPVGAQVAVATYSAFVSVMTDSVQVEPASERLIPPYSVVTLTKVGAGLWLVAKGSGGTGSYFNEATGGTVAEITNYNGTGETWRTHTFTGSGTLNVISDIQPFRVLVVAGGGAGGYDRGGGGGGGGVLDNDAMTIAAGAHTISVGGAATNSSAFGLTALKGGSGGSYSNGGGQGGSGTFGSGGGGGGPSGGGGVGTSGQGTNGSGGGGFGGGYGGGRALSSNITGAALVYGARGPAGDWGAANATPARGGGGFGGRHNSDALGRTNGGPGIVIVAYQIA